MTPVLSSLGVGSGLNTAQLVADLAAAERAPKAAAIQARQERASARISALAQARSSLDAFVSALQGLSKSGNLGVQPVSSHPEIVQLTRAANASPPPVNTSVEVMRLAKPQTLNSGVVADEGAPIGHGTLTINFGTVATSGEDVTGFTPDPAAEAVTVTIDAANDSLTGLRDAINAQRAGVTASIVYDGTGSRLVLKGETGEARAFTIDAAPVSGSEAGNGLENFAFRPGASNLTLSEVASDALVRIDGIMIERSSNQIADVIEGYRLDLRKAEAGTTVVLQAERDTELLRSAVNDFAAAYNEMNGLLRALSSNATANEPAGPLRSDSGLRDLQTRLSALTTRPLASGGSSVSLAEVGVITGRDGSLSVDAAKLNAALASDPAIVEKLFSPSHFSDSTQVSVRSALGTVKAGSYEVTGLMAAKAASATGSSVPGAFDYPVEIDATNASFTAMLDGLGPLTLTLPVGSYVTGNAFAQAFANAINSDPAVVAAGRSVTVVWDGDHFTFRSRQQGSRSQISISGLEGALATRLGLSAPTETTGTDAQGVIGGKAAVGNGSRLVASASSTAAGLTLEVRSGAPSSVRIDVAEGLSGAIARIRDELSKGDGSLAAASARLTREQSALAEETRELDARIANVTAQLTKQFTAMERAVASYKSIGSFLDQQIAAWSNNDD